MTVAPMWPATYQDSFSRSTSNGWGTSGSGHAWVGEESYWYTSVSFAYANVDAVTAPNYDTAYIGGTQSSSEVLLRMKFDGTADNPITDCGPIIRRSSSNTFYMARLRNNNDQVAIAVYINGTMTTLKTVGFAFSKDIYYWVRFRSASSGLYLKVWKSGTIEPSSWTLTSSYSSLSGAPLSGRFGFGFRKTTNTYQAVLSQFYGYTLEDQYDDTIPLQDTFDRVENGGLGRSSDGRSWEGNLGNVNPVVFDSGIGDVSDPGDGRAVIVHPGDSVPEERVGFIGPSMTGNVEALVKFSLNTASGTTYLGVGLYGNYQDDGDGTISVTGYQLRVKGGSTNFELYRKTAFTGGYIALTPATNTAYTALLANTVYWVRFQIVGATIQARIWADGATEPSTWQYVATDSSLTSGRIWLSVRQVGGTTTTRALTVYDFKYSMVGGTNGTITGAVTLVSSTSTSLNIRAAFTGDANNDNTLAFFTLKDENGTTIRSILDTGFTRSTSPLSFNINFTGLKPNTNYTVSIKFDDLQGVSGTNPVTGIFSTLATASIGGDLTVTAVGTTTAEVKLTYTLDIDNDSTASLSYRSASTPTQTIVDGFEGNSGVDLTLHTPDVGSGWLKHLISSSYNAFTWRGRAYQNTEESGGTLIYYQPVPAGISEYDVEADIYFAGLQGGIALGGRISDTQHSGYYAYPVVSATNDVWTWRIVSYDNNVLTIIDSNVDGPSFVEGDICHFKLLVRNNYLAIEVDDIEIAHIDMTTNKIGSSYEHAGLMFMNGSSDTFPFTAENTLQVDNFVTTYRTYAGTWTSAGTMTADRGNKWFTKTVSGLVQDTIYNFRATLSDPDSVYGNVDEYAIGMTIGHAVQLDSIVAIPRATSAILETMYLYDSNNNSSLTVQYRPIHSLLWTTVTPKLITANRSMKKFTTTIVSLRPNMTYEVQVTISDPDGLVDGTSDTLTGMFTTKGPVNEDRKENKHYLWKVYDSDDKYITTWEDAGEPEFAWHENGGVSDLTVVLPRSMGEMMSQGSGINHQNRVDIWCIDPSSDGFGPNMENDPEFELGAWTLATNADISLTGGPDDSDALRITSTDGVQRITRGDAIELYRQPVGKSSRDYPLPLVIKALAQASGSKLTMFVESYNKDEIKIDASDTVDTVGNGWQTLRLEYVPPTAARYVRVCFQNEGRGTMYADKVEVRPKELLIYRGRIETYTPKIDQDGENITIEILGLVSVLSDDYIEFLQFVTVQPSGDFAAGKKNYGPTDPGDMLKKIIDTARRQNPRFDLYYTPESIRSTGIPMEYTLRDQQVRTAIDKVRNLCPSGWHYYIEPDGLVVLRGPEHVPTYTLRIGVEIMNFSVERSIRNLKNFVHVKGRQDEDESEPDGFGSIHYIAFDQESIDKYGKRMLFIRDANITDPDTAEFIANGRLEESNREEQRAECYVPDEKSVYYVGGALRGANIEEFRPGDQIIILDPLAGPQSTYWDQLLWDVDAWDSNQSFQPLPESVPIKTVQFSGTYASLELSERQPSSVGDFGRLYRWLQLQDADNG